MEMGGSTSFTQHAINRQITATRIKYQNPKQTIKKNPKISGLLSIIIQSIVHNRIKLMTKEKLSSGG